MLSEVTHLPQRLREFPGAPAARAWETVLGRGRSGHGEQAASSRGWAITPLELRPCGPILGLMDGGSLHFSCHFIVDCLQVAGLRVRIDRVEAVVQECQLQGVMPDETIEL